MMDRARYVWMLMPQKWHSCSIRCWEVSTAAGQSWEKRRISLTGASQLPVKKITVIGGVSRIRMGLLNKRGQLLTLRRGSGFGG